MASSDLEKGRISTSNSGDIEEGVLATTEGSAHRSGIGNPGPMGLFAFASTTFMLSMFNVQTRGITHPNVVVGMAIFAAFSSYGAFWMSYATINIPASGVIAAFNDPNELASALGIYLITWGMVTLFFLMAVLRKNVAYTVLLSVLTIAFALLAATQFTQSTVVLKAGGVFGIITSLVAYYIGVSEILAAEKRPILCLPLGVW
ncbi:GPR1/FUN34/yaaH family-domain-containing protein [Mycena sp. CBHHK59/15]|nr:GPR1/FUN34/yaaH family-domain-containing protein [Mycena sp. CBHHK59/15]